MARAFSSFLTIFFKSVFIYFLTFLSPSLSFSHPLDITFTVLSIQEQSMRMETSLHPYQVEFLLKQKGIKAEGYKFPLFQKHSAVVFNFIKEHFKLSLDNVRLNIENLHMPEQTAASLYAEGLIIKGIIPHGTSGKNLTLNINAFIHEFKLQTNKIAIINESSGDAVEYIFTRVETEQSMDITTLDLEWKRQEERDSQDADGDGLSDRLEKLYGTHPNYTDTDADGFLDSTEVYNGWDPLSKSMSPGQTPDQTILNSSYTKKFELTSPPVESVKKNSSITRPVSKPPRELFQNNSSSLVSSNGVLKRAIKELDELLSGKSGASALIVFITVYILGVLHSAGVGHGKTVMVGFLLDKEKGLLHGIYYSLVLTVTHILDILILGVSLHYLVDVSNNPYELMNTLQKVGVVGILGIATYQILKFFRYHKRAEKKVEKKSMKGTAITAFFIGLAPCSFGWAIFSFILSTGKTHWVVPVIGAFGAGIFSFLVLFAFFIYFLREKLLFKFSSSLERYSYLLSGGIMLTAALLILFFQVGSGS